MPIAMDFGTCNTVIARWRPGLGAVEVVRLPSLTRRFAHRLPGQRDMREANVLPSLIHYGEDGGLLLAEQVAESGLADHNATFRWVKLDMLRGNTRGRRVNGQIVPLRQAATDLVHNLLTFSLGQSDTEERDLILTVPVEAYDHYMDWLHETVASVFRGNIRFVDEATACILGYQEHVRDGEVYLVFDFGGGTLDVSVVKVALGAGRDGACKCTILGRAGEEVGGGLIDRWMIEALQAQGKLAEQDIRDVGAKLLRLVEDAKIDLSGGAVDADITQFNDRNGRMISCTLTSGWMRDLLQAKQVNDLVSRTVNRALEQAAERYAVRERDLKGIFLVGGSSLLLGVADFVRQRFPDRDVRFEKPFEAIAAGACRYAGEDLNPSLVHEYGTKSWNPKTKEFEWVMLIPRGTIYPTEKPVCGKYVTTAVQESDTLGLVVWERSSMALPESAWSMGADGGLVRVSQGTRTVAGERELNPEGRNLIHADPVCEKHQEKRFVVGFGVNRHKQVTVSIKDTLAGNRSYVLTPKGEKMPLPVRDFPLVKL
jgi:molecular chaperone DnaK